MSVVALEAWQEATKRFADRCRANGDRGAWRWWQWVDEAVESDRQYVVWALAYWGSVEGPYRQPCSHRWTTGLRADDSAQCLVCGTVFVADG